MDAEVIEFVQCDTRDEAKFIDLLLDAPNARFPWMRAVGVRVLRRVVLFSSSITELAVDYSAVPDEWVEHEPVADGNECADVIGSPHPVYPNRYLLSVTDHDFGKRVKLRNRRYGKKA